METALLQELINKVASGILVVNKSGDISFANDKAHTLFGYPAGSLIDTNISCLIPAEYKTKHAAHVSRIFTYRQPRNMGEGNNFPALHADQHVFYIAVNLEPCSDGEHMIVTVTETTRHQSREVSLNEEKQELSLANQQLLRFTQQTFNGLVITDSAFAITWSNLAMSNLVGYSERELQGKHIHDFAGGGTSLFELRKLEAALESAKSYQGELKLYHQNGNSFWASINMQPFSVGKEIESFILLITDITEQKQLETQLIDSNNFQTALLNSAPLFLISTDNEGLITSINTYAAKMLQCRSVDVIGQVSPLQLLKRDSRLQLLQQLDVTDYNNESRIQIALAKQLLAGAFTTEITLQTFAERSVDVELTITALQTRSTNDYGLLWMGRDITAQRTAERENERHLTLIESTGEIAKLGGWELDLLSNQLWWSDQVYHIHELPVGSKVEVAKAIEFYAPEAQPIITAAVEKGIKNGTTWDEQLPFITAKGRRIWVRAVGYAVYRDGHPVKLRGAFQDISELKQAEQDALAASAAKSQFLANMSHEIRTPLNGVIGINELLKGTQLNDKQRDYVDLIHKSSQNLMTIINDILDVSKIEAGHVELTPSYFSLPELINDLIGTVNAQIKEQKKDVLVELQMDAHIPTNIYTDPNKLRQILANLLSNAFKFTDQGHIRITVKQLTNGAHQQLEFIVADSGVGIPHESVETLFDKFTQADSSSTRGKAGTGLGLSICRELTHLLGGEIQVHSEPGVGSSFSFYIPIQTTENQTESIENPVNVLLVVDNQQVSEQWQEVAPAHNFECHVVHSAPQALQQLKNTNSQYTHLIVYADLPGMDGFEFCKVLHQKGITARMPVLLITSAQQTSASDFATELGVQGIYTDTTGLQDLIAVIQGDAEPQIIETQSTNLNSENESADAITNKKVLLVEDNQINQLVAQDMLQNIGCEVLTAENGREAVEIFGLNHDDIDIIFMDCQMPVMDGFDATRAIRALPIPRAKSIAIVAVTANALDGDDELCRAAGMNDHVAKPVSIETLKKALSQWAE
ncbi:PAS domain S-box protein [Alteromonas sp. ASW11-36]|uniref:histidine kinase n=1 Tax=Alteromonas arenosi TaxID=3055817 RepID=A0ABT7STY0_9ALTE|nr:PAS domain S-box protein [Alteromonas sp. ASW11-36]MDM7859610.1 PAS domain S-box protein [Alteromonas sp. ASW11-36]